MKFHTLMQKTNFKVLWHSSGAGRNIQLCNKYQRVTWGEKQLEGSSVCQRPGGDVRASLWLGNHFQDNEREVVIQRLLTCLA